MKGRKLEPGVVILAAGASTRMGRPKMLLPWGGTSVLGHLITQWRSLGDGQIAVVCADDDRALQAELDRLNFPPDQRIHNPHPESGMFSSIQCAARWTGWRPELTHWAIVLGDQPHLERETLDTLLEFAAAHPDHICQPGRGGRPRHPVLLPARVWALLKTATATDLKQFLNTHADQRALCELEDAGLDIDLDLPEDYRRASGRGFDNTAA